MNGDAIEVYVTGAAAPLRVTPDVAQDIWDHLNALVPQRPPFLIFRLVDGRRAQFRPEQIAGLVFPE
jgi:hypothetical protein